MFSLVCVIALTLSGSHAKKMTSDSLEKLNAVCVERNAYYIREDSCDSYVECNDFVPTTMTCPEGLNFDPNAEWPSYPCGYPVDIPCMGRIHSQPTHATADCPHQYGYFQSPLANSKNCGHYRLCTGGHATEMTCPSGLAFNSKTRLCDWPELVPTCNVKAFLGFACPHAPLDDNGKPIDNIINFKHGSNCHKFYSCELGHARLLQCDQGLAFSADSRRCISEDFVDCDLDPTDQESKDESDSLETV